LWRNLKYKSVGLKHWVNCLQFCQVQWYIRVLVSNFVFRSNQKQHYKISDAKKRLSSIFCFYFSGDIIRQRRLDPLTVQHPVAFHALLEGNEQPHLGRDQIIKYNHTVYNAGHGYDAIQGVFTAPKAGIYIFSASITSAANEQSTFWAELTKDDTPLARLNVYGRPGVADQSSVTVVSHLAEGQQVWVKVIEGSDVSAWGDKYSYFTGFLLHVG